jgi:hypothetical protein
LLVRLLIPESRRPPQEELFPIVASTAAKTEMTLGATRRAGGDLQDRCRAAVVARLGHESDLDRIPLPTTMRTFLKEAMPQAYERPYRGSCCARIHNLPAVSDSPPSKKSIAESTIRFHLYTARGADVMTLNDVMKIGDGLDLRLPRVRQRCQTNEQLGQRRKQQQLVCLG